MADNGDRVAGSLDIRHPITILSSSSSDKQKLLYDSAAWMWRFLLGCFAGFGCNAEDYAQEVLLKFFSAKANKFIDWYRPDRPLKPALRIWLRRMAIDYMRRLEPACEGPLDESKLSKKEQERLCSKEKGPETTLVLKEELAEARKKLKARDFRLFRLHFFWGHSLKEVAAIVGMTEKAVYSRIYRARERLPHQAEGGRVDLVSPAAREPRSDPVAPEHAFAACSDAAPLRLEQKLYRVRGEDGLGGFTAQLIWQPGISGEWIEDGWWLTLLFPVHAQERRDGNAKKRLAVFDGSFVRFEWREEAEGHPWITDEGRLELDEPGNLVSTPIFLPKVDPTRPAKVRLVVGRRAAELYCD